MKKFFALFTAVAVAFAVVGCGGEPTKPAPKVEKDAPKKEKDAPKEKS